MSRAKAWRLVERRRTPRRSTALVEEMILHRDALQAHVMTASLALEGPVVDVSQLREVLSAVELNLHAFGAKTFEWATVVQDEMAALRRV